MKVIIYREYMYIICGCEILPTLGESLNGDIGLSLKDRNICFLLLFYDRTVLFG